MTSGSRPVLTPDLQTVADTVKTVLSRLAKARLHVSAGAVAIGEQTVFRAHVATSRFDLAEALGAHAVGLDFANEDPQGFDVTVSNAMRLRALPPTWEASSLPVEEIQEALTILRQDASAAGMALYLGENTLRGIPDSVSFHLAGSDDLAFSSHVAMLIGLSARETDPAPFERACSHALARLNRADGDPG
jgi:hypothetical protein